MKLQLLVAVCILTGFAAAGDEKQLDQLCAADDEKVKLFEAFVKPTQECMKELQPEFVEALSACNTNIYGSDPRSAAEAKRIFCPKDAIKMKALGDCLTDAGIKEPTKEAKAEAKKKMNECLAKKASD
ncbi:hypothetical protein BGZ72_007303 [Mortierella alpina]|nr:hypothetical protein BGZ72_007303 [Mortierella alpina]